MRTDFDRVVYTHMPLTEHPIWNGEPKKKIFRVVLAGFSGIAIVLFLFFAPGARDFLRAAGSVFSRSLSDTISSVEFGKLAAEVDLQVTSFAEEVAPVDFAAATSNSEAGIGNSAAVSAEGNSKTQKLESAPAEFSDEEMDKDDSALSSAARSGSQSKNSFVAERQCVFDGASVPSRDVIFNEIAWMGSAPRSGESATASASNEWIELKNNSGRRVDLSEWRIVAASGKFKINFEPGDAINPHGLYFLERADDDSVSQVKADKIYSGALSNSGARLGIFSDECALIDEIDASAGWPAGDNGTKQTFERNANDFGWHASVASGGTPGATNSSPSAPFSSSGSQAISSPPTSTAAGSSFLVRHSVGVSTQGGGSGTVTSDPVGINCGFDCSEEYAQGTNLILAAHPDSNSVFDGWSGACAGGGTCGFSVINGVSVVATFRSVAGSVPSGGGSFSPSAQYLLIAEVQIAGASTTHDFIKVYNSGDSSVDASGWKLRKKTSSGTEYSVRVFPAGSVIQPHGYFIWANSSNAFDVAVGADISSTQTIAADNSIALLDSSDTIADALAWGLGHTSPYIEGTAYSSNPDANKILSRKFSGGAMQDTDNNSADFEIK